ncbi:acyl-CoA dehydrogenase family protein [Alkalimonas collagenimarina]|uniref:Acyl-CoA dehydrogenase family protein n=1 Tax=Alkalimonas collagenimarina TaxID=400390 RepID=A0ABT9H360_9GAMM|nr:acyl-CoA dehydrogenase family protein [Alkalimonas collagenimarina]MDP4537504.1 acyl-CoA dehydrogenase family protein [Alkalimonas collagenimarina]
MSQYQAPIQEMQFHLFDVWQADQHWQQVPELAEMLEPETAQAILQEAAKICEQQIAPLSQQADQQGVTFQDGAVRTPDHYKEAYKAWCEGGWAGFSGDQQFGGMGMPKVLSMMLDEMMCSADIAFSLYPGLTAGACVTLSQYGSEEMKQAYLPKLYSGEWSATMCLTESHAGSDLGLMRTQARPQSDGSYLISGSKIFITAGEHDLTDNIVHLVLAKLPDAPAGSRGISLFVVPKLLLTADGEPGEPNKLHCGSVEHKMGIHASATCVMNFDGAKGYLLGEPHKGLAAMFTMMNYERLAMGSQGLGAAERAYQNAFEYANERLQGRITLKDANQAEPIIQHPDVERMLMTIKALNEAGRSFSTWVALSLDQAKFNDDVVHLGRASLLTPIAKAFMTDLGLECTVQAQQVFGGHGYVKEWGMEQLVRDVRIAQIYEGTNGIQAADFMLRKVAADQGATLLALLHEIAQELTESNNNAILHAYVTRSIKLTESLLQRGQKDKALLASFAYEFMTLVGYVLYGYMWQRQLQALPASQLSDELQQEKRTTAQFYFQRVLPRVESLLVILSE